MKVQQRKGDNDIEPRVSTPVGNGAVHEPIERVLLHAHEAAIVLGISRAKTYELLASRELPAIKIGRSVRISRAALYRWIAEREGMADEPGSTTPNKSRFGHH